jgi:hypothetical protein
LDAVNREPRQTREREFKYTENPKGIKSISPALARRAEIG